MAQRLEKKCGGGTEGKSTNRDQERVPLELQPNQNRLTDDACVRAAMARARVAVAVTVTVAVAVRCARDRPRHRACARDARRAGRGARGGVVVMAVEDDDGASSSAAEAWERITAMASAPGVCDLGQGWPDFGESATARKVAMEALAGDGEGTRARANQYSPVSGAKALVEALETYYARTGYDLREYGSRGGEDGEVVVVTCSATEALYGAFKAAITSPEDEILFIAPYFPWYHAIAKDLGGKSVTVRAEAPNFAIDVDKLRAAVTPQTKLLVHCSPHNPSGHVATRDELEGIARVAKEFDLTVLADEVYERSVFGEREHVRLATIGDMRERTITVGSASKLLNLTGFRVGWAVGPPRLLAPIKASHSLMSYCAPTPLQLGVAAALDEISASSSTNTVVADENAKIMRENADILASALRFAGLEVFQPHGGYFLVASCAPLGLTDMDFCLALCSTARVACVPMSVFYLPSDLNPIPPPRALVRFAICKVRETIEESARRIRENASAFAPTTL